VLVRGAALATAMVGSGVVARVHVARAQQRKQTKTETAYQDHPNGQQHCGVCADFIPPAGCQIVEGEISPNGWCRNFTPRPDSLRTRSHEATLPLAGRSVQWWAEVRK
jgi:hypothetical protein